MTTHETGWLSAVVRRTRPVHLVVLFGLVAAGVGFWLDSRHTAAEQIMLVSLVLLVIALLLEAVRDIGDVKERLRRRDDYEICLTQADTLRALEALDNAAPKGSVVRAVWSAVAPSDEFSRFMAHQLHMAQADKYILERWVDTVSVPEAAVLNHVAEALPAINRKRYMIHLVGAIGFGAMAVDESAGAVNFSAHEQRGEIIGVAAEQTELARAVRSLINTLDEQHRNAVVICRRRGTLTLEEAQAQVRSYYATRREAASEIAPLNGSRWSLAHAMRDWVRNRQQN